MHGFRKAWLSFLLCSLALVAALILVGCGSKSNQGTSSSPRILTEAGADEPYTWDPSTGVGQEAAFFANTYEALLRTNPPGSSEPYSPWLATDWIVSNNGTTWTFHLRKGVKFHDGSEMTAEAVKYSYERVIRLDQGLAYAFKIIKKITVVDRYTVEIQLKHAVAFDTLAGAGACAFIISPETQSKGDKWFNGTTPHEDGTGPYMFVSYSPKEQAVFTKFDGYWGGWKPGQFDRIVYKFVPDAQTERQMLESGEIGIALGLSKDLAVEIKSNPAVTVGEFPSYQNLFIFLNCQKKPLDNVLVRQALSYATPYQDIITVAEHGEATQSHGPIPTTLWPGDPGLPAYTYDLSRAKQLLAQAGYPNGGLKLVLTVSSSRYFEGLMATLIKESYAKIGVDVTVKQMPFNEQWANAQQAPQKDPNMFAMYWWPNYADGYDTLATCWVTESKPYNNLSYWYNKNYDNLIMQAHNISGLDRARSKDMFMTAQKLLINQAVTLYLYDETNVLAWRTGLTGVALNPNYPQTLFWYDIKAQG